MGGFDSTDGAKRKSVAFVHVVKGVERGVGGTKKHYYTTTNRSLQKAEALFCSRVAVLQMGEVCDSFGLEERFAVVGTSEVRNPL